MVALVIPAVRPPAGEPFTRARWDVARALELAGLGDVTLDPGALVPFVLVDLVTLTPPANGVGGWPGTIPVKIVVPPPGDAIAAAELERRLTIVVRTLGFASARPYRYELGDGATAPAYELTYPRDVPNPDC